MNLLRLTKILHTFADYRVKDLLPENKRKKRIHLLRLFSPFASKGKKCQSNPEKLRKALEHLGPIFVKFGQVLSTRPDLIPLEITKELSKLQDDVEPFAWNEAKEFIEQQMDQPLDEIFSSIDEKPLASASVAQVHAAELKDGREVVIKVLRPGIRKQVKKDLELMRSVAKIARTFWNPGVQVDPLEIVAEFERTIYDELDLQREAANASVLRKNFSNSNDLYIPEIYWQYCKEKVMVMERIYAIPIGHFDKLKAAKIDLKALSEKGLRLFYTQVFRDNFFHADMHPGNIFVNPANPQDPQIIVLDFGICGSLPKGHKRDLANNFMAFFNQDYRRIAELHIEAGWVPADTRVDELESATRTICEPYFSRPISEISFGEVMLKTFEMARKFNLVIQPEFILLQKTLLNIEGLGRQLYPELDIWKTSKPVLASIMRKQYGMDGALETLKNNLPRWLEQTSEIPTLVHEILSQQARPLTKLQQIEKAKADKLKAKQQNKKIYAILASGFGIISALLYSLTTDGTQYFGMSIPTILALVITVVFVFKAIKN
ncbi:MAG TPA: ubiquinone biosynthesis regulatory protein kinase UbiB [Gammaproteobacteria bacterium]|nr:ubiquinone biosynthesis regulatory protein kinase UbiB [Xanthomonadales bacterium]MCB1593622.1 ubiquinone biosynthesis regulatory protein kinase UbiB [Xanthomonadales bacterium]HOP22213.1 ubiquinone biosynthesis regulatory protein kinase UbiB [Gammaproteobacteria bacterium]HPI95415.1 ubiquinone biosynthesis regulatory protein kinase UbiB [Gammaproteobacteria bacterium]HPQ87155.1 ubiquinone biosynthesis regulatory protein kinase UbiB [Gammaproteobacteria bacterium]